MDWLAEENVKLQKKCEMLANVVLEETKMPHQLRDVVQNVMQQPLRDGSMPVFSTGASDEGNQPEIPGVACCADKRERLERSKQISPNSLKTDQFITSKPSFRKHWLCRSFRLPRRRYSIWISRMRVANCFPHA